MRGICKSCNEEKALQHYQKEKRGRLYFRKLCVQCWSAHRREYQEGYRAENVVVLAQYHQSKHERSKKLRNEASRRYYRRLQKTVFDHYGSKCSCCGESEQSFLSVDHKNNDGAQHRKKIGIGHILYRWIIDNEFPTTLQLLCCNCNMGKHRNGGVCPHETARMNAGIIGDRDAV